jgi:hypothetical protein
MRKITGKVASLVVAAALVAFLSSCTNSPLAPDTQGGDEYCYTINGTIVCVGDNN